MKTSSLGQLIDAILLRKVAFLVTFFVVFLLSYAFLAWLDFLPEPVKEEEKIEEPTLAATAIEAVTSSLIPDEEPVVAIPEEPSFPDTIVIDALEDRTIAVLNPTSRTVADLDAALLYGVVRHPDSATLEQTGTVFVLGHSSYLPTVLNPNFQAFNGIQNLRFGDTVRLQSGANEYVYRVEKVYRASAQDVVVPIAGTTKRLVLATCNSFGSTDDRFIVEAEFQEVRKL